MTQHTMPRDQSKPLRGREVIEEAARLLRQMRFSANRGAYAEGHHVAISVDPRWNDDHETFRMLVTCYAFGHRRVDWEGLPVFVRPEGGEIGGWLRFLNAHGQTILPNLPQGEYGLSTSSQYGRSLEPVPLSVRSQATRGAVRTKDQSHPEYQSASHIYECKSADGRVLATIRQTPEGKTEVAFVTEDAAFAEATVRFAFVLESGRVEQSAEVELKPVEDEDKLWEGYWQEFVAFSEPCELVFEVLPKEV